MLTLEKVSYRYTVFNAGLLWSLAVLSLFMLSGGHFVSTCNTWHKASKQNNSTQAQKIMQRKTPNKTQQMTCCQDLSGSGQGAELCSELRWSVVSLCMCECVSSVFVRITDCNSQITGTLQIEIFQDEMWTISGFGVMCNKWVKVRVNSWVRKIKL